MSLAKLREQIDAIDDQLVSLLGKRAELVLKVRKTKQDQGIDVYSPEREKAILERVCASDAVGPFPLGALEKIFRTVVGATRSLVGDTVVAYAGPELTVAHDAAVLHFSEHAEFRSSSDIAEAFSLVEASTVNYAVVPIEAGNGSLVGETLVSFLSSDLNIIGEIYFSRGASNFSERFFVLGRRNPNPTGSDKTALLCGVRERPGVLYDMLKPFTERQITLTKIESRAMPKHAGEYLFYLELLGHSQDEHVSQVLEELSAQCSLLKKLGSFPASKLRG